MFQTPLRLVTTGWSPISGRSVGCSGDGGRRTALAVTVHDPGGDFLAGLRRLGERLTSEFVGIGALVTEDTAGSVGVFIANELGARVDDAPSDVSRHRRGTAGGRWSWRWAPVRRPRPGALQRRRPRAAAGSRPGRTRSPPRGGPRRHDRSCWSIGRTDAGHGPAALAGCATPRRVVNHVFELMTGRALGHDVRRPAACRPSRRPGGRWPRCTEDTIANDVEWPLVALGAGRRSAYEARLLRGRRADRTGCARTSMPRATGETSILPCGSSGSSSHSSTWRS